MCCQLWFTMARTCIKATLGRFFRYSGLTLSGPDALLFLSDLMLFLSSWMIKYFSISLLSFIPFRCLVTLALSRLVLLSVLLLLMLAYSTMKAFAFPLGVTLHLSLYSMAPLWSLCFSPCSPFTTLHALLVFLSSRILSNCFLQTSLFA